MEFFQSAKHTFKASGASRAKYGEGLINALALRLTAEFGDGFTVPNLRNMRQFYLTFPKRYALRSELSWTHYRILMRVESGGYAQTRFHLTPSETAAILKESMV